MSGWHILSLVTFLPLVGVLLILFVRDDTEAGRNNIRAIALWTTIITFLVSLLIWIGFNNADPNFQLVEKSGAGRARALRQRQQRGLPAARARAVVV